MITLAERVVEVARSQLGVREDTGHNDGEPALTYMNGLEGLPWCAGFVAFCFRRAGRPLPDDVDEPNKASPLWSVSFLERICREHGWQVTQPMPGDIVFFARRGLSDPGRGRHVGIVEECQVHFVRTIEGNCPDVVRRVPYRRSTLETRATSYARVPELDTDPLCAS